VVLVAKTRYKSEPDIYIGFSPALHLQCESTFFLICQAVALVAKTRWDRYRLHMMPLYQFDNDQVMIVAHDTPERDTEF
jgi:hypothetical protein